MRTRTYNETQSHAHMWWREVLEWGEQGSGMKDRERDAYLADTTRGGKNKT